jgi:hypothetical protein
MSFASQAGDTAYVEIPQDTAPRIPEWLTDPDDDVALVLTGAWLVRQGEQDAGHAVAAGLLRHTVGLDAVLGQIAELLARYEWCWDGPREYAWSQYGLERVASWDEYAAGECERLLGEARHRAGSLVRRARIQVVS